jgi:hypothetical protein
MQVHQRLFAVAEREGFEPSVHVTAYAGLANLWFQPLTHLSGVAFPSLYNRAQDIGVPLVMFESCANPSRVSV